MEVPLQLGRFGWLRLASCDAWREVVKRICRGRSLLQPYYRLRKAAHLPQFCIDTFARVVRLPLAPFCISLVDFVLGLCPSLCFERHSQGDRQFSRLAAASGTSDIRRHVCNLRIPQLSIGDTRITA